MFSIEEHADCLEPLYTLSPGRWDSPWSAGVMVLLAGYADRVTVWLYMVVKSHARWVRIRRVERGCAMARKCNSVGRVMKAEGAALDR